jgi:hypothetical protein
MNCLPSLSLMSRWNNQLIRKKMIHKTAMNGDVTTATVTRAFVGNNDYRGSLNKIEIGRGQRVEKEEENVTAAN